MSSNPCDLTWTGPIDATTSGNPSIIWDMSTLILADTVKFPLTLSTSAVFTLMVPIATKPMILLHLSFSAIASKISASVSSVNLSSVENSSSIISLGGAPHLFANDGYLIPLKPLLLNVLAMLLFKSDEGIITHALSEDLCFISVLPPVTVFLKALASLFTTVVVPSVVAFFSAATPFSTF